MGPESKNDYTLYLRDTALGGTPIEPGIIHEITVPMDALTPEALKLLEPMEFSVTFKTPKHWRCRSRKRYIKLMMSEGITRNYAEKLADFTRTLMPSYGEAWRNHLWHKWG